MYLLQKIKNYKFLFFGFILLLFLIGLGIRIYNIEGIPPGIDWDEASIGYNAFSLVQTGKDEWGKSFPLIFQAFGDYKLPLYIYSTAGFITFLGLSVFSIKITAILAGSLSILVLYFLAQQIFKNRAISLLAATFLTFSPQSIFFSRLSQEVILCSFFILCGLLFEIWYIRKKRIFLFYLSFLFLGLSLFTYNLARIVSPLLLGFFFIVNTFLGNRIKNIRKLLPVVVLTAGLFLFIALQFTNGGLSRLSYTGIFGQEKGTTLDIQEFRQEDHNSIVSQVLHNKATFFVIKLAGNYISHFSTSFLVNFHNYGIIQESFFPPLYIIMLPFYFFGIYLTGKKLFEKVPTEEKAVYGILLFWIIIAPLPSMITENAPSSKRYLGALGSMELLTAYSLVTLWSICKREYKKWLVIGFCIFYTIEVVLFLYQYFIMYPRTYDIVYRFKENTICKILQQPNHSYDEIIYSRNISGEPQIFPLFCLAYNPNDYLATKKWHQDKGWFYIDSFGKYTFYDAIDEKVISTIQAQKNKKALFLTKDEYTLWQALNPLKKDSVVSYGSRAKDERGKSKETLYLIKLNNE
jgi:4-amino-4-deoxy-L-arabinose transferase-like glycosyltransferase